MEDVAFVTGGAELLATVGPLWEELREHHAKASKDFSHEIRAKTFRQRTEELLENAGAGLLRVDIAYSAEGAVGYCVATLKEDLSGEIDSIFVKEDHRSQGIGSHLMLRALEWLDLLGCEKKTLSVVYGNEKALDFYREFGFYPRRIVLEQAASKR
jgi:ribosomal protein S18 acetylase RimI-like enzyme